MKIAIIGAGVTGLISLKYALEQGFECDSFEQTGLIGGTWNYTDRVGTDENGLPVHSAMYKGLRTNLPKETMAFLDFPYPEQVKSYLTQPEVLDYFNCFADCFNLRRHIKFYKYVTKVKPLPNSRWAVTVQDAKTKVEETKTYDSVFVCSGHYRDAMVPKIPGQDIFKGSQSHSHDYRIPEPFKDKRVLVIGAGPSGQDISMLISKAAKHVFISHRGKKIYIPITENITEKPIVKYLEENRAVFEDGTSEDIDMILYCTGYKYTYPFLTEECGIKVHDNWVHPLHKDIVNIEHPTMYFIGIPFMISVIPMFDIQARYALAALAGKFTLPSKEDMLNILREYMDDRKKRGVPLKETHNMGAEGEKQLQYFDDLAATAGVRRIPTVVSKLYGEVKTRRNLEAGFKILDDENFIQIA
ncbi:hypothetical protein ILUMI_16507 [Ignelater luminosus]|uniref:Flavin-containing monooxygenase n=1 Tax=Ignelater luminosus TaxID=2038154 RepID=A0A8K0G8H2_IGNLU|nr:hypothetical protein ILUMI_16507 [Ignelater luminosus]